MTYTNQLKYDIEGLQSTIAEVCPPGTTLIIAADRVHLTNHPKHGKSLTAGEVASFLSKALERFYEE